MGEPIGAASVPGISVVRERAILLEVRKTELLSHVDPHTPSFNPYVQSRLINGEWLSSAEFVLQFRKGQRQKTRSQVNRSHSKSHDV